MGYANGQVPATALATIAPQTQLVKSTANAYKAVVLLGHVLGWTIRPAAGVGSGYRSLSMQTLFYNASHGNKAALAAAQLSPSSLIGISAPGGSSHGYGTAIDLVFNGSDHPTSAQIALLNHCGFTRQFGADDPNHFLHDARTAISGPNASDWVRILAHYYNGRHLGRTTTSEQDGTFAKNREQNYTWLVQAAGIRDGIYKSPPYKHDGIWGPHTDGVNSHYHNLLWNAA